MQTKIQTLFNNTKKYVLTHKLISIIILLIILFGGYYIYKKITSTTGEMNYTFTTVQKGTIIASISGTGQVSASNQIDIKSKASGDITYVTNRTGQNVGAGTLIASFDSSDAEKAVRDAQASLESAQISLEKLKIADSTENISADLTKAYDDGFNNVSNTFLDLPTIMTGLDSEFYKSQGSSGQLYLEWYQGQAGSNNADQAGIFKNDFDTTYKIALAAYTKNFTDYKAASRTSDPATIESLILETYSTTKLIADAIKNGSNYLDFVKNAMQNNNFQIPSILGTNQSN